MKTKKSTRVISLLLAIVMVVLILPAGVIIATAEVDFAANPKQRIGLGFNAITDSSTSTMVKYVNWLDSERSLAAVRTEGSSDGTGLLEQHGEASFAKSALEMMTELGVDYTTTVGANFTMNKVKAGVETKFKQSFSLKNTVTTSELYYYYTYKAVCNRYTLPSDYSNYLSDEFLTAVKNINLDSPLSIETFFKKYGTHMLTSFETGGEVYLNAWAYSESANTEVLAELENSVSANVGVGDVASATAQTQMAVKFGSSISTGEVKSDVTYDAIGGDALYVDITDPSQLILEKDELKDWVNSVPTNPAFISSSSEWVSVWEVLPETAEYENIRQKLYEYFVEQTKNASKEFLTRFCSLSNRVIIEGYTYISPDGYVSQNVPYEIDNYVAPGSLVSIRKEIDDSIFIVDSITTEIDTENSTVEANVDKNGVIRFSNEANPGEKLVVKIKSEDITIRTLEFEVKLEGDNVFSGGYGTKARPYLLKNEHDIHNLSTNTTLANAEDKYYLLVPEDNFGINMSSIVGFGGIVNFAGTFDGNGYRIYGYNITNTTNTREKSLGLFHTNTGTIKNLTVGYAESSLFDGYSAKVYSKVNENADTEKQYSSRIGGLVGKNEGTIDNCHVENVYVYGELNDKNNNKSAYCCVGALVGTNDGGSSVITRCSAIGNKVISTMGAKEDSGDDNHAYAAGIAAISRAIITNSLASNNNISAEAKGNGLLFNKAYAYARAGGIAGYTDEDSKLSFSASYGNEISAKCTATEDDTHTEKDSKKGGLIGRKKDGTVESCYTTQQAYSVFGQGTSAGGVKLSTNEELNQKFAENDAFAVDTNGNLIITPVTDIKVSNFSNSYVEKDYIDLQDCIVYGTDQNGNKPQEYNKEQDEFTTVNNFNQFQIKIIEETDNKTTDFYLETPGTVTVEITGYGGYTAIKELTVSPKAVSEIEILNLPNKMSYYKGDSLDTTGLRLKKIYNTAEVEEIENTDENVNISGYESNKLGVQTITVTAFGFSDSYDVTVYAVKPTAIAVNSLPNKTAYALGDSFDMTGLSIDVVYNNGTRQTITNGFDLNGFDSSTEGTKEIEIAYTFADVDLNEDVTLYGGFTVNVGTVVAVAIKTLPNKVEYYTSDGKLDLTGLSLELTYSNGATKTVTSGFSTPYGYDLNKSGIQDVMVSYNDIVTSFEINVKETVLSAIEISHLPKTQYYIGETFSTSGLSINRIYNNGISSETWSGYTVMIDGYEEGKTPTFVAGGRKTVTIYYVEGTQRKSVQYEITISAVALERIEISQMPYKTKYKIGDIFTSTGMVVNAIFNNGNVEQITDFTTSYDFTSAGGKVVTVWYLGESASLNVTVVQPEKLVISKFPETIEYQVGDTLDLTGIQVAAVYYDNTYVEIDITELTADITKFEQVGNYEVTLTYKDLETSFNVFVNEFHVSDDAPKIVIENAKIIAGKTVTVAISLQNNPGIASLKLNIEYDETILTLTDIQYNSEIGGQHQLPQSFGSPVILNWFNGTADSEGDFTFATLTFDVLDNATVGNVTNIIVSYDPEDVYNINETNVTFYTEGGTLEVIDYVPGDINEDGVVNNKDMTRLFQYLSAWDVDVNENALDVNGDGSVNNKDLTRLFQYLSGWEVEIN